MSTKRVALLPAAALALAVAALPLAGAGQAAASPTCLWAGTAFPGGTTVSAGGASYRCDTGAGYAHWARIGAGVGIPVGNPGAASNPAGHFSPGARQPGTGYLDHCVGAQLIYGSENVYEVVDRGGLMWQAVAPISHWPGGFIQHSHRTSSSCLEGNLT